MSTNCIKLNKFQSCLCPHVVVTFGYNISIMLFFTILYIFWLSSDSSGKYTWKHQRFHSGILSDYICLFSINTSLLKRWPFWSWLPSALLISFPPTGSGWILSRTEGKQRKTICDPSPCDIWEKNVSNETFMIELQVFVHICLNNIGFIFQKKSYFWNTSMKHKLLCLWNA